MSNRRDLTPEELAMAARMREALRRKPELTEQKIGELLGGLTQGAVSHWTGGRLAVPASRAVKLAQVLEIDDPCEISVAYRKIVEMPSKTASLLQSHPLKLNPVMIAETHRTLRELEDEEGRVFFLEDPSYAAWFVQVYEMRAAMPAQPSAEEWVEYGRKLQTITQGAVPNGRDDGVPAEGAGKKRVARKVRG